MQKNVNVKLLLLLVSLAYFTTIQCFYYLVCEVKPFPCNNGTCKDDKDNEKGYKCDCKDGFTGDKCEKAATGNTTT